MSSKAVIILLIVLGLVYLSEIVEYFKAAGRCIIFARQNIQAYKTPKIRRSRAILSAASVAILTLIIYPDPCLGWAFPAGYIILRSALPYLFGGKVSDHDLFFGAFTAFFTFLPFAAVFIVLLHIIFTGLSWWDNYGWIPFVAIFGAYFFRLLYIENRLLKSICSPLEAVGFMSLIEVLPLAIFCICYFFA